jgi:hypothetical protein
MQYFESFGELDKSTYQQQFGFSEKVVIFLQQ